jgi:hypothetical protein
MKNTILVILSLLTITQAYAASESEPVSVTNETPRVNKASGDLEWFSELDFWQHFHFKAELEKLSYQTLDQEFELDWALEMGNADQFNYEYLLSYDHSYDRRSDLFSGETVRSTSVSLSQDFDINRIKGKFGFTTHFGMDRVKENNIYLVKYNVEAAPVGLKYDFCESDKVTEFSLSYLPTYYYSEYFNASSTKFIDQSLLHVIKLNLTATNKTFTFTDELAYKMAKHFDDTKKISNDYLATNKMTLSYHASSNFTVSYNSLLSVNRRRKLSQNLPSTDHKHGLSFSFLWN